MTLGKIASLFIFLAVLAGVGAFGVSIGMHTDGAMSGCPFISGGAGMCPMDVFNHIASWQLLVAATAPIVFAGLVLLIAVMVVRVTKLSVQPILLRRARVVIQSGFFNPFRLIFAKGIVHAKLYA